MDELLVCGSDYQKNRTYVGGGRFGIVYSVIGSDKKMYALREIAPSIEDGAEDRQLTRQIEIFALLKLHPSVAKFYGYFISKNKTLVLEYLPHSLEKLLNELSAGNIPESWTPTNRSKWVIGFAAAMMHLHSFNAVHRYLSPGNLMFDKNWNIKLTDFGFAKIIDSVDPNSLSSAGREDYMYVAPEALQEIKYDKQIDVYAFGMILYAIAMGRKPEFPGMNIIAAQRSIISGLRPNIDPECPEQIRLIIENCWCQEPDMRKTFAHIVKALVDTNEAPFEGTDMKEYLSYRDQVVLATNFTEEYERIFNECNINPDDIPKFEMLLRKAESNKPEDLVELANAYEKGLGTIVNKRCAFDIYMRAAKQNYPMAMYKVGMFLIQGEVCETNLKEALIWFKKSSNDCVDAAVQYALLLSKTKKCATAARILRDVADAHNHSRAQYTFARMCEAGLGVEQNFDLAREYYNKARDSGYEPAVCDLAKMLIEGRGGPVNVEEAIRLYMRAGAQSFAVANYNLGSIYAKGEIVPADAGLSRHYYEKAARQGNDRGMVRYANILIEEADMLDPDDPEAEKKYQRAAEFMRMAAITGNAHALNNYGKLCITGKGVPLDASKGCICLTLAARRGIERAMMLLGDLFSGEHDFPVQVDVNKRVAARFYEMAVVQKGNQLAQKKLEALQK